MKVALGTLEIDEPTRKKIGKAVVGSSYLKRDQAKDWALGLIDAEIAKITGSNGNDPASPPTAPKEDESIPAEEQPEIPGTPPASAPKEAGTLPEPAPATTPSFSSAGI